MLNIKELSLRFNSETIITYPDWSVSEGSHAMILGTSGSGKTSLLHILSGLLSPTSGEVLINNIDISKLNSTEIDLFRKKNIGIIFQKPHLVSSLTVMENLLLAQQLSGKKKNQNTIQILLDELNIGDIYQRKTHQISQGQAQRVAIARAAIKEPKILLADEPTASLDDENCEKVIGLLQKQAKKNKSTLIVATHDQRVKSHFNNTLQL